MSDQIRSYWDKQAEKHGASYLATMPDKYAKDLEIESISRFLRDGMAVLDAGCGNGYSTFAYAKMYDIEIVGLDYSKQMIVQAEAHNNNDRVQFICADVLEMPFGDCTFDMVLTDRCLTNLTTRPMQEKALQEIHRVLKPGGAYIMCENTQQGLSALNDVREHAGLPRIEMRWHNLYLDEGHILPFAETLFTVREERNFASFYYLASRIINARISQEQGQEPRYDHDINRVAALVSAHIDCGNYSSLKLYEMVKQC